MRIVPNPANAVTALMPGAAVVVANGMVAGVPSPQLFSILAGPGAPARDIAFTPDTLNAITALTADLEASSDNGVTWTKFKVGMQLFAAGVAATIVATNCPCSLLYRLNFTTLTGTSASVTASVS
jgi:hypothetical protein